LPTTRKGKNRYSTEASVLEELRPAYPFVKDILEYRQLTKIKSTYIDTLPEIINPKTGRIHTSFNQTRTTTGRLSSSDPNMQNIPVRGELGGQVRQAFIAPPGLSLLAGDYSQIDLRALAHLSQDEGLLNAFRNDEDIHAATASQLFGVEKSQVTKDMRRFAKTVNFGVIYGMSDYGLEQATELSRQEAGKFIKAYFEKYPGVRKYLDDTKEQARRDGYVQTLLGRRRYIPDINSANIAYKLLTHLGGATAIGPMLLGIKKPVYLLIPGNEVNDIVNITALAVCDVQKIEGSPLKVQQEMAKTLEAR
jgi:DNA polymerase-1